ncbi:MAG: hypothetical protein LQ341_002366 [Variospora aurantia]|nr:MAG: hypothetical protein LQ341_002366 [Variospora aurantia]
MVTSPLRQTYSEALVSSQQASGYIASNRSITGLASFPLFTHESYEQWTTYENMLYSCLRTGDDKSAHYFLQKLALRFGKNDERVMGLRGLYQEAMAKDSSALLQLLREYDEVLDEDPTNTPVRKRQITILRSLSREADAINALVELLAASPTDIESWAELAEHYVSQGLYQQAEFCLEEILLSTPNAWNVHARLGEVLFVSTGTCQDRIAPLAESVRRFCRSIELCDGYIRGLYGLKLASEKLMAVIAEGAQNTVKTPSVDGENAHPVPSIEMLQKLSEKATSILAENARKPRYDQSAGSTDLAFVADLLNSSTVSQGR